MIQKWAIIVVFVALAGCSGGGDESGGNFVPNIELECPSGTIGTCTGNGKTAYFGLIETLTLDCDDTLTGLNSAQRQALFLVSGTAVTVQSGGYLTGRITNWINSTGGQQDVLNPGTYQVCGFIDANGNGVIDANEPVGKGQVSAGTSNYIVTTWNAAYN